MQVHVRRGICTGGNRTGSVYMRVCVCVCVCVCGERVTESEEGGPCVRRAWKRDREKGSNRLLVERRSGEREGRSECKRDSFQSVSLERHQKGESDEEREGPEVDQARRRWRRTITERRNTGGYTGVE